MKKFLILLLLTALLLTACGAPDPLPMTTQGENRIDGKVAYTLADFYRADSLTPPIQSGEYPVYDAPAGTRLWVALMDVENLTGFSASPKTLLPLTLTVGENQYSPAAYLLENGSLTENGTVAAQSEGRVLYVFALPPETESATLTATVAGQPYTAAITPKDSPKMQRTALDSTLTGGGLLLKLETFTATQKLKPTAPATMHTFFDAGDGNTHLVLKTTAFNNSDVSMDITRLAGVTVGTTPCIPVVEAADGSDLSEAGEIPSGESRTVYFAAPFPADQADKKATVTVNLFGDTYRFSSIPTSARPVVDDPQIVPGG